MFKATMYLFAGAAIALSPLAGAGSSPQDAQAAAPQAAATGVTSATKNPVVKPTADSQAKAKELYSIDCALCHNDNGDGKTDLATTMALTLPDLSDPKTLQGVTDGDLFNLIRTGKDKMPGEDAARAKDPELWNLVIYVRNLSKAQAAAVPPAK